jgi:hypothetical protein
MIMNYLCILYIDISVYDHKNKNYEIYHKATDAY